MRLEHASRDDWPGGVSDGLTLPCIGCGRRPTIDYTVTDWEWHNMTAKEERQSVLCLECFVDRGGNLGEVTRLQVVGNGQTLILLPEVLWVYED